MPLDTPPRLRSALQTLAESPGATIADCAKAWTDAVQAYASTMVPPSTALVAACTVLKAQLVIAFSTPGGAGAGMETAFHAFAGALALGIAPPIVTTPPSAAVGFVTQFASTPKPSTHAAAAAQLFALINTWMHTGSGVIAPAAAILWS